jgi:hypothetical protein
MTPHKSELRSVPSYRVCIMTPRPLSLWDRILMFFGIVVLTRKDCPHWNVDGYGQCNLLPDPEPCVGYSRCMSLKRYFLSPPKGEFP